MRSWRVTQEAEWGSEGYCKKHNEGMQVPQEAEWGYEWYRKKQATKKNQKLYYAIQVR